MIEFNNQQLTCYEAAGQEIPKWTKNLRSFGEAGVVKIGKNGKLGDRRITCIFVNYAEKHSSDCYRMYNPKSGKIIETRDIQWLNKMYFRNDLIRSEYPEIRLYRDHEIATENEEIMTQDEDATINPDDINGVQTNDHSEYEVREGENLEEEESSDEDSIISTNTETSNSDPFPTQNTRSGRAIRKPQKYRDPNFETNLTATTYQNYYQVLEDGEIEENDPEIAAVGAAIGGGFDHTSELIPIKFKEAMT